MPTYEYECQDCKAVYDLQQSFTAETTHTCERCGKGVAKRVLHAPRVVFKGAGWYITDSKKASSATKDSGGESKDSAETAAAPAANDSAAGGSAPAAAS